MQAKYITKATDLAKFFIEKVIRDGDIAVDATIGNGNDTLFLSQKVGKNGKVFGFDIQQSAIDNTRKKLLYHGLNEQVLLIKDCHGNMDNYIKKSVRIIMFNLGYLPGGDQTITTKVETTLRAINKGLELLEKNGIMTIAIYSGHKEGEKEKEAILNYCLNIDQKNYNVLKLEFINQRNNPPLLVIIEKKVNNLHV